MDVAWCGGVPLGESVIDIIFVDRERAGHGGFRSSKCYWATSCQLLHIISVVNPRNRLLWSTVPKAGYSTVTSGGLAAADQSRHGNVRTWRAEVRSNIVLAEWRIHSQRT